MRILYIIALLLGVSACNKSAIAPTFQDLPVVEGYLEEGSPISIKISRQVALDENAAYASDHIAALNPTLYADDVLIPLTLAGEGIYTSPQLVQAGKAYKLSFTYNQKLVTAQTVIPITPQNYAQSVTSIQAPTFGGSIGTMPTMPDPVKLTWDNADNSYYVVVIENVETDPTAINTGNGSPPARVFRNQPTQNNSYEIRVMQFNYYGKHHIKLYHLNPDYAVLYSTGSTTSQNLFTPTTSITNGVGIFTGVAGKVLELTVTQ